MNRLLIIGHQWPEPTSSAAGARMLQLIEAFKEASWEIIFACAASQSEFAVDLGDYGCECESIQLNDSSFDKFVKSLNPTVVLFDRFMVEEQYGWRVAKACPRALRILDTEDLHSLRNERQLALKQGRSFELYDLLLNEMAKREVASIYRCDLTLMISEFEMQVLQNVFSVPKNLLHHTPFMCEKLEDEHIATWLNFEERRHFVSIGNFLHAPNQDAVQWLKDEIWPMIRAELPAAELHIYGAYAPHKIKALESPSEGFIIKGRAEDAREVVGKYKVLLAPLRFGAGLKGKLVDAMFAGTPSVTTTVGAEAMHKNLEWPGAISDAPKQFAGQAITLHDDSGLWFEKQKHVKEIINRLFSKTRHSAELLNRVSHLMDSLDSHRKANFTGAMLMHHTLRSTEFMSRWIEEKEKKGRQSD